MNTYEVIASHGIGITVKANWFRIVGVYHIFYVGLGKVATLLHPVSVELILDNEEKC